jgi:integrase
MATFRSRNGRHQAIIRRAGMKPLSKTFAKLGDARKWATGKEYQLDHEEHSPRALDDSSLRPMITRYEREMWKIKKWGDTKDSALSILARDLDKPMPWFTKVNVLGYARKLHAEGLSPSTIDKRLSYLREVFGAARDLWGAETPLGALEEAVSAGRRLKIIGSSQERDRRPTDEELAKLLAWEPKAQNAFIDLRAVVRVLSIMPLRLSELCADDDEAKKGNGIAWERLIPTRRSAIILGRKHPDILVKEGRVDEVPLIDFGRVDTYELVAGRPDYLPRPFPYRANSVSQLFRQACFQLKIDDLHLHDLRAHAISSLLEAEIPIPQVAKLSGHRDWKVLAKVYARLRAAKVHTTIAAAATRAPTPPGKGADAPAS